MKWCHRIKWRKPKSTEGIGLRFPIIAVGDDGYDHNIMVVYENGMLKQPDRYIPEFTPPMSKGTLYAEIGEGKTKDEAYSLLVEATKPE